MEQSYLKVVPSDDQYKPTHVPDVLKGLQQVRNDEPSGWTATINPFSGAELPRFEFVALSAGEDAPVEFYYGTDEEHLDTLESRLRDVYPYSFDIEPVEVDLAKKLVQPVEHQPEEFLDALEAGTLWVDEDDVMADTEEILNGEVEWTRPPTDDAEVHPASYATNKEYMDALEAQEQDDEDDLPATLQFTLANPDVIPDEDDDEPLTALEKPAQTEDGTVYARPTIEHLIPKGYRWHGVSERKRDWMCQLTPYTEATGAQRRSSSRDDDEHHSPLAPLIDRLGAAEIPLAFQVVFRPEPTWQGEAIERVKDLEYRRETMGERIEGWIWYTDLKKRDREDLPSTYRQRIEEIEDNRPGFTFAATIRALTVERPDEDADRDVPRDLRQLNSLLSSLNGDFYKLRPRRFRENGLRTAKKDKHARKAFERFRNRELLVEADDGRDRPQVVANPDELASLVTVPSADDLSVDARRDTEAEVPTRTPLAPPKERLLRQYKQGLVAGFPLNDVGNPIKPALRIPPELLLRHYVRLAATGHGKSVAVINDILSIDQVTDGPTVLLDRKGDGMCRNYLRAHYEEYGDLEDVVYIRAPEMLPTIPFFDIRPALAAGQDWESAVQDRVEHFRELLRLTMGEETHDRAYLANDTLGFLIKAMFDPEHGQEAFGIDDLYDAIIRMQRDEVLPPMSAKNIETERTLANFFQKDRSKIENTLTAMEGRVNKLKDQIHVYRMLNTVPEWDEETEEYVGSVFDFREFLDDDVVILVDIGDLRPRGQHAFSMAVMSNVWDAVKPRGREDKSGTDYPMVNLIIEEAAPLVTSSLLYEDLIPQGRGYGVGLGLVMQFPEQVERAAGQEAGKRPYNELMNNVDTKIAGRIPQAEGLADVMAGGGVDAEELATRLGDLPPGEWIVDPPAPLFGESAPRPFSLASASIPKGHPDNPLDADKQRQFERLLEQHKQAMAANYGRHTSRSSIDPSADTGSGGEGGSAPAASTGPGSGPGAGSAAAAETKESAQADAGTVDDTAATADETGDEASAVNDLFKGATLGQADESVDVEEVEPDSDGDRPPTVEQSERTDTAASESTESIPVDTADVTPDQGGGDGTTGTGAPTGEDGDVSEENDESADADYDGLGMFVDEDDIEADEDLSHLNPHQRLLKTILDAMNRELEDYSLVESMTQLKNRHEEADLEWLLEEGYLEEHSLGSSGWQYYTVLPEGRRYLRESLKTGEGVGDLGEKTPHKVGVELLRRWLADRDEVEDVTIYYEQGEIVYDVAAFDKNGSLVWVGEVETETNDRESVRKDYKKLAAVDAKAIWVFETRQAALDTIAALADADYLPEQVSGRAARSYSGIQEWVEGLDTPGMTTTRGYGDLFR